MLSSLTSFPVPDSGLADSAELSRGCPYAFAPIWISDLLVLKLLVSLAKGLILIVSQFSHFLPAVLSALKCVVWIQRYRILGFTAKPPIPASKGLRVKRSRPGSPAIGVLASYQFAGALVRCLVLSYGVDRS